MEYVLIIKILIISVAAAAFQGYSLDYEKFKNKNIRIKRSLRSRFLRSVVIEGVEAKFDWNKILQGERMGTSFILKKSGKMVENAVLYFPRDESFVVRNLFDAVAYDGELRILREKKAFDDLNKTSEEDTTRFKFDSPRIVTETESKSMLKALKNLPHTLDIESISVSLKIPKQNISAMLEVSDLSKNKSGKMVVHIVPNTISVVVNDLPSHTVVKMAIKSFGPDAKESSSAYLFTGSITSANTKSLEESASRISLFRPNNKRRTVTCFVENKSPFQGFACRGSNVCVPLHWECDGDDDCLDGYDEQGCQGGVSTYSLSNYNSGRCRRNEFECSSRGIRVCLPVSWLCDGRTDCSDGWDEDRENCPGHLNNQNYHLNNYYPSVCSRNYFKCRKGGCVAPQHICDGHKDCSDGSDEYDCPDDEDSFDLDDDHDIRCDPDHEFVCGRSRRRKKCVPRPWVCDDQDDCPDGEDEDDDICTNHYHNFND